VKYEPEKAERGECFIGDARVRVRSVQDRNGGDDVLAKNKYQFEKRLKELARKKKKEEKRQRKLDRNNFASKGIAGQVRLEEGDSV